MRNHSRRFADAADSKSSDDKNTSSFERRFLIHVLRALRVLL
jgi:hypothetical protein